MEEKIQESKRLDSTKISMMLVVIVLIVTILNSFLILNINNKINTLTIRDTETGPAIKETQPLGQEQQPSQPSQPSRIEVSADDDAVLGNKNAPITIIEFSDFECPFCGRFFSQTLPSIKKNYIDTGKAKLVYRDFPLSFHPNAQKAAEAAECAKEQGKFWEMHDLLFEKGVSGGINSFKQYAKDLRLDTTKFNSCLDSGKYANEVQKDFQDGQSYGVSGTPTFFINGQQVVGAQPFSTFQQIIEQELTKNKK